MTNNFWGLQNKISPNQDSNSESNSTTKSEIDLSKVKIPNVYPTDDGKYRVYITLNRKTKYIGTFDSLEDAINARAAYLFDGTLPETRKQRVERETREVLAYIQKQKQTQEPTNESSTNPE